MITIIDTNFLPRYFIKSSSLGIDAVNIFENASTFLIIPSIVLVELKYSIAKGRLPKESMINTLGLVKQGNCMVYPLDETLLDYIPTELE